MEAVSKEIVWMGIPLRLKNQKISIAISYISENTGLTYQTGIKKRRVFRNYNNSQENVSSKNNEQFLISSQKGRDQILYKILFIALGYKHAYSKIFLFYNILIVSGPT